METRISSALLSLIVMVTCAYAQAPPTEVAVADGPVTAKESAASAPAANAEVRAAFSVLVDALHNRDGKTAGELVPKSTFELYEECRRTALDSSAIDFEQLPQTEVLLVLQLRYMLSREELSKMTGKDVFEWGVNKGLVSEKGMKGISLGTIQLDGDVAFATLLKEHQPVPGLAFRFVREDNRWTFDMPYISKAVEPAFAEIRKQANKSKIELAVFLMEQTYKRQIPFEILQGPLK
jgi:hypothetical protein